MNLLRDDHLEKIPEDELRIEFKDAYETSRTEFTRDCSATLLISKDLSDSIEISFEAIQTEAGNILVRLANEDGWAKAAYIELNLKINLDKVRKRHPGISKEEQYRIMLYGEPGEQHNAKPQTYSADPNWSQWKR